MREKKKWELWMGIVFLMGVVILSTIGMKKTVQNVIVQQGEKKVIVIDAGHGGGYLR